MKNKETVYKKNITFKTKFAYPPVVLTNTGGRTNAIFDTAIKSVTYYEKNGTWGTYTPIDPEAWEEGGFYSLAPDMGTDAMQRSTSLNITKTGCQICYCRSTATTNTLMANWIAIGIVDDHVGVGGGD